MSTSPSTTRPTEQGGEPSRIASYLSLGVTGALMATATSEAAIVSIDLTNVSGNNISGVNGGVTSGSFTTINNWLGAGTGQVTLFNGFAGRRGLAASSGLSFSKDPGSYAVPRNWAYGATIGGSSGFFSNTETESVFKYGVHTSPDFGAGSFMGFRFGSPGSFNYGYLEVTWSSSTNTFQILSGAYESTVNTAILAGATAPPSGVPVPAASLLALMALGGNSFRRSRTRAA
jgi:hypothetical protein